MTKTRREKKKITGQQGGREKVRKGVKMEEKRKRGLEIRKEKRGRRKE